MKIPLPAIPSLLYPNAGARSNARPAPNEADLGLTPIIRALDYDGKHSRFIASVLAELNNDPGTIRYRQDCLDDLLRLPDLATSIAAVLPNLAELAQAGRTSGWVENIPLVQVANRLAELDNYFSCVEGLASALDAAGDALQAESLLALRTFISAARAQPEYQRLAEELPRMRTQLDQAASVTLGINLDAQLRPESATIVSINTHRYIGKGTLFDRLFGEHTTADAVRSITALYKADEGRPHTPEHELFRNLDRLLERVVAPVAEILAKYTRIHGLDLAKLEPELAFYLGAARLTHKLQIAGLALCRPTIAAASERICSIDGVYSLDLALRLCIEGRGSPTHAVVPNTVAFSSDALIFILTGPNSGGKTTYTRAVGQTQTLFQAGLRVPGQQARISPVDGIFTHFAAAERIDASGGRLAEELERLAMIFRHASQNSLILLNEPLSSTDHSAARILSRDILAGLQLLGARVIFVTHVHELVSDLLDTDPPATAVVSLIGGVAVTAGNGSEPIPNYHIAPGRPQIVGYAAELARQHGLSLNQIRSTLRERGIAANSTASVGYNSDI